MDRIFIRFNAEDVILEFYIARFLAGHIEHLNCCHLYYLLSLGIIPAL